nr:integrase, catalytic region, zinc finger, CCHC-type, peptidase aspartic, catalytic [Tanacetum cinerariifolium]
ARVQNFKIQFLQEAAKFVRDFKSLTNEADESLDKQKYLELKIERLLKASVSHDIMSIVQNSLVDVPSDLRTELDRTKEKLELCIIKKEKEYAVLWNKWYRKCEECKYDKISYDKAYNDMQQKVERLQAQLRDLKGTVRFRNDHIAAILEYGDLKWGNITITRVYFIEGLGHNLFSVGQFCDADLEVAFRRNTCFIRDLDGFKVFSESDAYNEYGIRLMLAPRSANARYSIEFAKALRTKPEPGDQNHKVLVNETFHEQTYDELTEKELKQVKADDQAIQTILLGLPEDIYAAVDSYETGQEIWNQNGYNAVQNVRNQGIANQNLNGNGNVVAARAKGNAIRNNGNQIRCYNYRGLGHFARNCTVRPRRRDATYLQTQLPIAQKEEAGIQLQVEEFDLIAVAADLDEIKETDQLRSKLYAVTPFLKSTGLPKIDETHALSKPVTLNSVPTLQESKVVKNNNVISPGMFRLNPFKTSREENSVPKKPIKVSIRTNPITVSQPHALTKKGVNSNSNGLSSTGVDNIAKTRRPQPRSNTKNDRVPFPSKSSYSKNKKVKVEEHPRNLLLSKNKKHMSSECNNVKLAIQNDKSKVVCVYV